MFYLYLRLIRLLGIPPFTRLVRMWARAHPLEPVLTGIALGIVAGYFLNAREVLLVSAATFTGILLDHFFGRE